MVLTMAQYFFPLLFIRVPAGLAHYTAGMQDVKLKKKKKQKSKKQQ